MSRTLWRRLSTAAASASTSATDFYDVCIIGSGIVGTALASALSKSPAASNLKIALIDFAKAPRAPPSLPPGSFSNRVSSVTPESVRFLRALGAWDLIGDDRKKPYTHMKVWDAVGHGAVHFDSTSLNQSLHPLAKSVASATFPTGQDEAIAWIVENSWLLHSLVASLGPNVDVIDGVKVLDVKQGAAGDASWDGVKGTRAPFWPAVTLEGGRTVAGRLLVGADGANSIVKRAAGIGSVGWSYPQHAIVATLEVDAMDYGTDGRRNVTAYQRFLPEGPIALLPLSDTHSSLVWSTTPALAAKLVKSPDAVFTKLVDVAVRGSVPDLTYLLSTLDDSGNITVDNFDEEVEWSLERYRNQTDGVKMEEVRVIGCAGGSKAAWPLRMGKAEEYIKERIALVGDAAHSIHPLAGQGLNLGFSDAKCLADLVDRAVRDGQDVGQLHVLQPYARQRYAPNLGMVTAVDAIGRLFRAEFEPLVWARSFGLKVVDAVPPLKMLAMKAAASL
ncbi:putative ubiquinone biosynthesis monooxygenase [Phlyctochytrium bullatum]|nr:putative ubiquinone biosynthesis monooxygenase [Phlyctochytrium bullatum]